MFDNIGVKIKSLAKITCWIGIISSIIVGISIWSRIDPDYTWYLFFVGLVVIVVGSLASWISCFFMYGFAELILSTKQNEKNIEAILLKFNSTYVDEEIQKPEKNANTIYNINKKIMCDSCGNKLVFFSGETEVECPWCGKLHELDGSERENEDKNR